MVSSASFVRKLLNSLSRWVWSLTESEKSIFYDPEIPEIQNGVQICRLWPLNRRLQCFFSKLSNDDFQKKLLALQFFLFESVNGDNIIYWELDTFLFLLNSSWLMFSSLTFFFDILCRRWLRIDQLELLMFNGKLMEKNGCAYNQFGFKMKSEMRRCRSYHHIFFPSDSHFTVTN